MTASAGEDLTSGATVTSSLPPPHREAARTQPRRGPPLASIYIYSPPPRSARGGALPWRQLTFASVWRALFPPAHRPHASMQSTALAALPRGVRAHGSSLPRVSWLWLTKPYLGLTQAEVRVHAKPKGSQPQAPEPIGLATLTNATANHPARVSSQASSHRLGLRARSSAHSQSLKREGAQQVRPPRPRSVVVKRQSASQSD